MRRVLLAALLLAPACESGRSRCERLAKRLMPEPDPTFIAHCAERYDSRETRAAVACLLAVEGGIYDADLKRCHADEHLPLIFQF